MTAVELDTLMRFYADARTNGGPFDAGIQRGLERVLAAPAFLFRVVREPAGQTPGSIFPLSDLELASRLSFFLWSSVPDDALRADAARGRLRDPAVLQGHVRRMLSDVRARALVDSFALQWLKVGKVAGVVPDVDAFPEFDENLRRAMLDETRAFLADQLARDRPVPELVTADYSFLNDRLARHYGVAGVYGSHFRRVAFTDGVRGGLLGQASVLTATSYPNRTSPVLRGRWLLDTVLGSPPPPPPPDVPTLEQATAGRVLNQREQMEAHRKNPACATLPRADGSARLLARTVRRARAVAGGHQRRSHRRLGHAARWLALRRRPRAAGVSRRSSRRLRADVHREAARVRARARAGAGRHAGRARHRARRRRRPVPLVVDCREYRAERPVPPGVGERRARDATAGRRVAAVS